MATGYSGDGSRESEIKVGPLLLLLLPREVLLQRQRPDVLRDVHLLVRPALEDLEEHLLYVGVAQEGPDVWVGREVLYCWGMGS